MEYFQHFKTKIFVLEGFSASVLLVHFEEECPPCAWSPPSIPPCPDHQCSVAKIWHFIDFNPRTFVSFHRLSSYICFQHGNLVIFPVLPAPKSFWCFSVGHGRNFFVSLFERSWSMEMWSSAAPQHVCIA